MMVGNLLLIVQLNDGVEHNLQEWIQLGEYQPNIHHPHIRGGWQFCHYAANDVIDIIDCMAISHLIKRVVVTRRIDKGSDVTFQAAIYPGSQVLLGVLIGLILIF